MLIFLVIIALIIAIIVLTIRYFLIYARLTSHKAFDREAKENMEKKARTDPYISCDYCGTRIDTRKDRTCPHCGASYGKDEEWIKRNTIDSAWVNKQADKAADARIREVKKDAKAVGRKLRILIIILVVIVGGLIALAISVTYAEKERSYVQDQEVNRYSFENYEEIPLTFENDGVIAESDGVTIQLAGFYRDADRGRWEVGYHYVNNSDQDMKVSFYLSAINGYADYFGWQYDTLRKGADLTIYETLYTLDDLGIETIESVILSDISIRNADYETVYEQEGNLKLTTDQDKGTEPVLSDGQVLFENDEVTIVGLGFVNYEFYFEIQNKTDYDLTFKTDGTSVNGKIVSSYGSDRYLPSGCIYKEATVYSSDDSWKERQDGDVLRVNISFTCTEHPELNFSTGYLETRPTTEIS